MLALHTVCELVEHELFGVRPTAFLDRDGTINVKAPEGEYVTVLGRVRLPARRASGRSRCCGRRLAGRRGHQPARHRAGTG